MDDERLPVTEVQGTKIQGGAPPKSVQARGTWANETSPERVITQTKAILQGMAKVKILIPSTEQDKSDITIGVNGHVFQIKRDVQVEVPYPVVKVLESAKLTTYTQRKRTEPGSEGNELVPHEVLRIPFQKF